MKRAASIKVNPKLYFEKENSSYNREVVTIIDDIFQTNTIDKNEYILVGDYVLDQVKEFTPFTEIEKAIKTFNNDIKTEIVPPQKGTSKNYENLVAHLMLNGGFDTYVIAGGMGTGKTSACDFITDLLIKKLDSKGNFIINIKFDFNTAYTGNEDDIIKQFNRELYDKLYGKIAKYFSDNEYALNDFCEALISPSEKFDFSEFVRFKYHKEAKWVDEPLQGKVNKLLEYIDTYPDSLIPIMKLLNFIAHNYTTNSVIFVFDNIDILQPPSQRNILYTVFKYNNIAKIKCFIPLRRATFKRTLRDIQQDPSFKAAYAFGYIHHHGVEPVKVVLERVSIFLKNAKSNPLLSSVDKTYKIQIINRFQIYKSFLEKDNNFYKFFNSIVGRSSRVALALSKRFFINNVIEYSNQDFHFDTAIKAFMVHTNDSFLFDNQKEMEIANTLGGNSYGFFSFLPYLILSYIDTAANLEEFEIRHVYKMVMESYNNPPSVEEFADALNYILFIRRPLIWSDDKSFYSNDTNFANCINTLQFTELGKGYFEIIHQNVQYLQECLMSLRWHHDYIPQKFDSVKLNDRFSFLRKCIQEIFNTEKLEMNYNNKIKPLSTILFTTIGNFFAFIIHNNDSLHETLNDEVINWKSLRTELYNAYDFDIYSIERISKFLDTFEEE